MFELATKHWGKESSETSMNYSRIEWIKNQCKNYFYNGGMNKFDEREKYFIKKDNVELDDSLIENKIKTSIDSKINILDVGSCYNPFKAEELFAVTAIDIAPYSEDVIKCDFLNLKVKDKLMFSDKSLIEIPKNYYDAVIFSLFLEYIPCSKQRKSSILYKVNKLT